MIKRFSLKKYTIGDYAILDDGVEIAYASYKSAFTFCELLNKLHEENERLKSENNMLKNTIGRNESYIEKLTHKEEWSN